ncbi:hypothetical protein WMY93_022249 [Mugilogobius chulae]|uniref:Uncharacterized protein n=1 Tax=Mugilogobius chulae TaxID=88201 RepID=A0AAW0NGH5_9GOBI
MTLLFLSPPRTSSQSPCHLFAIRSCYIMVRLASAGASVFPMAYFHTDTFTSQDDELKPKYVQLAINLEEEAMLTAAGVDHSYSSGYSGNVITLMCVEQPPSGHHVLLLPFSDQLEGCGGVVNLGADLDLVLRGSLWCSLEQDEVEPEISPQLSLFFCEVHHSKSKILTLIRKLRASQRDLAGAEQVESV